MMCSIFKRRETAFFFFFLKSNARALQTHSKSSQAFIHFKPFNYLNYTDGFPLVLAGDEAV